MNRWFIGVDSDTNFMIKNKLKVKCDLSTKTFLEPNRKFKDILPTRNGKSGLNVQCTL